MTLEYKSGKWIYGLVADTKPTNVPDNSHFLETDTGREWLKISGTWKRTDLVQDRSVREKWGAQWINNQLDIFDWGCNSIHDDELSLIPMPYNGRVLSIQVNMQITSTYNWNLDFIVRKNSTDTAKLVQFVSGEENVTKIHDTTPIEFTSSDVISIKVLGTSGTGTADWDLVVIHEFDSI